VVKTSRLLNAMTLQIAVLLTCHNRQDKTSACLRSLRKQTGLVESAFKLQVFLVDDGCTDGTVKAALGIWPEANIITGDGHLYWCGGMRKAWSVATSMDPDYYLLVNDDTVLFPQAVRRLLAICPTPETPVIAVGAIRDPETGQWVYGGNQSDYDFVEGADAPRVCRTMNANCTLVPRAVYRKIGMFHHAYRHAMGDTDYGLEAGRRGIAIYESPSFVGECEPNPKAGTWHDISMPRMRRWRKLASPKGLPPKDWFNFCRRNCGAQWPRYWLSPYFRILVRR
jgi:GT2 family glycosyltransferase